MTTMHNTTRAFALIGTVAMAIATAGCAGGGASAPDTSPDPQQSLLSPGDDIDHTENSMDAIGEVPSALLQAIVAEAAQRAEVDAADVEVATAESVTWSDGSLGCPEPGMMYTQALVPGYRVVVEAGGEELHFHASESGDFRFCEDPKPPLDDGAS